MKKNKYLFVDGYNIINNWENLNKIKDEVSLDSAREELINILSEYQALSDEKVILVFDAYLAKGERTNQEKIKNINVYFTKEKETADEYIERFLDKIGKKDIVRVATSDGLIQQTILVRGGTRLSSNELLIEYLQLKNQVNRLERNSRTYSSKNLVTINEDNVKKLEKIKKKLND
ncbi:NYN domain-containing protein [Miniphocaeibacter massiliensis]|uniref:NYN domain-containing protein n=1 Tax=Miniphocaeibacter massiliensis TaxID=2041841 RepID=UPI000C0750AE|nr:NYN domain-containing protein [Miniphocaeibacter massiliensis]